MGHAGHELAQLDVACRTAAVWICWQQGIYCPESAEKRAGRCREAVRAPLAEVRGRWSQEPAEERAGLARPLGWNLSETPEPGLPFGAAAPLGAHHPATVRKANSEVGELLALSTRAGFLGSRQLLPPKSPECCR